MAKLLEFGVDEFPEDDGSDVDDTSHKKLLNAVSSLYRKQRIAAPKRNEPSLQISEFNLTKVDAEEGKTKLRPNQLLIGLTDKPAHKQINDRLRNIQKKAKPLPQPLEKFEEKKISRQVGYENVKTELSKWEATIQKNRSSDQLVFPLTDVDPISMKPDPGDILGTFSKPTELELKMAEVLNKSQFMNDLKEEAQAEKLTLRELIQRRNLVAKMRHRESYRIAKAVRQNKIKSKKYHRLLKRDRIKNELKEFELLQKTDPEAALAKLEKVERARAEERISLRHRNTGKWAKGLAIRAKYDTEARAQLAENLRRSREITAKMKASIISDSEEEEDDGDDVIMGGAEKGENPWVNSENEVASFVQGYRKFWEEQNKNKESGRVDSRQKEVERTVGTQGQSESGQGSAEEPGSEGDEESSHDDNNDGGIEKSCAQAANDNAEPQITKTKLKKSNRSAATLAKPGKKKALKTSKFGKKGKFKGRRF